MMRSAWIAVVALGMACTAREARPTVATPAGDPRTAVTEWSQVERFHCARGADGAVQRCTADAECAGGRVCDTSSGCGCCVPPPPAVEPGATLHRYVYSACEAGHCAAPRFCELAADGRTCTMRFTSEVPLWMTPWTPAPDGDALVDARRALCIRVEANQDCLWTFSAPASELTVDAPMPTRYTGSYECGGRTCNGHEAVRASPRVGSSYTLHVVAQRCGS